MCGIAGAVWFDPEKALDRATLDRMTSVLAHRGPDDCGALERPLISRAPYADIPGAALGHRRLSIIDLDRGQQPLSNEDGTVWVTFNGEIYNYRDLRRRLEGAGHVFRSGSDTETLVHLYEDEELGMFEHLNGMFAFALWDAVRGRLVLARDRLGKKPLVYRLEQGRLLFASELKSLLEVESVPRSVDPQALDEYLTYGYVPHPRTMLEGIAKLPPAHYAVYAGDRLTVHSYWRPDFSRQSQRKLADDAAELRSLLTSAVALRMQSDVPLGAFLSGGVDSSAVVGLMHEQSQQPIKTFSIGFDWPDFDETAYAEEVARRFQTEHHTFRVEAKAAELLPKLAWHYDEPFADSSALPTYCLAKLAREHVKVALTGDGGDELFAGYLRYRAMRLASAAGRLPRSLWRVAAAGAFEGLGAGGAQTSWVRRANRFAAAMLEPPERRYLQLISTFNESWRARLYQDSFLRALPNADPAELLAEPFRHARTRDPVTQASLADLVTYLPCDLLTKVDIASMAHGLECRQPLLDYRVVELAVAMPIEHKLHRGRSKLVLRRAVADLLPRSVARRRKMGFGVPLARWFRGELGDFARDVLLDGKLAGRGYFRPLALERLWSEHQSGRFDHGPRLWSLMMLELWHRTWIDGRQASSRV